MNTDNSGQAFPLSYEGPKTFGNPTGRHAEPGMTLRDYFAAKAMQTLLEADLKVPGDDLLTAVYTFVSCQAYCLADAMLAERAK